MWWSKGGQGRSRPVKGGQGQSRPVFVFLHPVINNLQFTRIKIKQEATGLKVSAKLTRDYKKAKRKLTFAMNR